MVLEYAVKGVEAIHFHSSLNQPDRSQNILFHQSIYILMGSSTSYSSQRYAILACKQ